jgi:hypothetical protein
MTYKKFKCHSIQAPPSEGAPDRPGKQPTAENENAHKFYVHEVGAITTLQTRRSISGTPGKPGRLPAAEAGAIDSLLQQVFSVKKDVPGENDQQPRKEGYTRQSPIEHLTVQLVGRYARRQIEMPARKWVASYPDGLTSTPHAGKLSVRYLLRGVKRNDGTPLDPDEGKGNAEPGKESYATRRVDGPAQSDRDGPLTRFVAQVREHYKRA